MKLLICTQIVDKDHPILGFFHRWIEEFAKNCEEVHVICLQKGQYSLPANVYVYSLGKEEGNSKLVQLYNFYRYIWTLRKRYDNVFVHMNQIYVILGGFLWRVLGKKIGLWYAHGAVSKSLRIAEKITHRIFTASTESFRLQSNKVFVTGHGIDTEHFAPQEIPKDLDLITVGRISASKNIQILIEILALIREEKDVSLTIIGGTNSLNDQEYLRKLKELIFKKGLQNFVYFTGSVNHAKLPLLLNRARVFVHAALNGSLDKVILEPLACGIPLISMAEGSYSLPLQEWSVNSVDQFVSELKKVLESDNGPHSKLMREYVISQHSINLLIPKIIKIYSY